MRGMTLIELLVVLVVVAVLATVAIPGYRSHVLRTHRVEARSALLALAVAQEKFFLQHHAYATQAELSEAPPNGLGLAATSANARYMLSIDGASATDYSATATATGDKLADRDCATLGINALGQRSATRLDGSASNGCWN
jgi:type IV pilus assembly protein PilE